MQHFQACSDCSQRRPAAERGQCAAGIPGRFHATVTNAHVCGTSVVSATFTAGPKPAAVNDFSVDPDNFNNAPDKITLNGLLYGIPPPGVPTISAGSGLGTSTPVFHFSGTLPSRKRPGTAAQRAPESGRKAPVEDDFLK